MLLKVRCHVKYKLREKKLGRATGCFISTNHTFSFCKINLYFGGGGLLYLMDFCSRQYGLSRVKAKDWPRQGANIPFSFSIYWWRMEARKSLIEETMRNQKNAAETFRK